MKAILTCGAVDRHEVGLSDNEANRRRLRAQLQTALEVHDGLVQNLPPQHPAAGGTDGHRAVNWNDKILFRGGEK